MTFDTHDLERWIADRTPPVPAGFASWMRPTGAGRGESPLEALTAEAEVALARALSPQSRPRGGAYDLLAADGFLTWAAEAALDADDPDAALTRLVDRVSR